MRLLATGNVLSRAGHGDHGDVVVVTTEEPLCALHNVADNKSRAEREDDVLVVWVQHHAAVDLAYIFDYR